MSALTAGARARTIDPMLRGVRRLLWGASSAIFLLLLASLFGAAANVPVPAAALFAFALFAAVRPADSLVAVAAFVPVAAWAGRHWSTGVAWPETVAVACLAGYAARKAVERDPQPADTLAYAVYAMIVVVVGSLGVELLVLHATLGGAAWRDFLWQLVTQEYFLGVGGFKQGDAAMRLIEGLLLAYAGATCARNSDTFGPRLVRALVAGAAVAGALTLWRLWQGAAHQDDPLLTFVRYVTTMRFNLHYADVNAAGSYYVMALLPAVALMLARARWAVAAMLIAVSLVLTGSRAAIGASLAALVVAWFRHRQLAIVRDPGHGRRWLRRAGVAVLVLACAGMLYAASARNATPAAHAVELRKEFTLTALRMLASRPVFGVGPGEYPSRSNEFSSPLMARGYPNENAHNNFLQVLAEFGGVGFLVFAALLAIAARRAARLLPARAPASAATVAGLLAFVLTWLAGHPLLIDEPALTFWLVLGTAAGWGSASTEHTGPAAPAAARRIALALLLVTAASIPARARAQLDVANLEHRGIGLSQWNMGAGDVRYRTAGATSTIFVPADAAAIKVALRAVQPASVLEVQLYLDGRHANSVRVPSDMWSVVSVPLLHSRDGRRFMALQLHVANAPRSEAAVLMVGKAEPVSR